MLWRGSHGAEKYSIRLASNIHRMRQSSSQTPSPAQSAPSFPTFVIGVAGGSGSGKSTVTREVLASVGQSNAAVLMQDDYYLDQSQLSFEERCKTNYDHPDAFDWPLLMQHVQALRNAAAIDKPVYDFKAHLRAKDTVAVKSAPIIVIEGLFALFDPALRQMMQLKVFVDTAPDVRFIRRLQRDVAERGRSAQSVIEQYLHTVRPMHKQFIEPTKRNAHIILPHGANGPAVDMITTKAVSFIQSL
jgi:uridine kinase